MSKPFDLDDILDSALDEYEQEVAAVASQVSTVTATTAPSSAAAPAVVTGSDVGPMSEADILKNPGKFADEIKGLIDELAGSENSGLPKEDVGPMMEQLQQLMAGLQNLPEQANSIPPTSTSAPASAPAASSIKLDQSLEQMLQAVSDGAKNSNFKPAGGDMDMDQMDEMLKNLLQSMGAPDGADLADPSSMDKVMADMMSKMFSKEMLKEPIHAVAAKYPDWIAQNRSKHSEADFAIYDKQHDCFKRICTALDKPGDDPAEVMELMQEMQLYGNPPAEITESLGMANQMPTGSAPGLNDMPPIPPEMLREMENMDPAKLKELQDACKVQ